ncbi:L-proline trans-4-hydroxylase-like isoform X2 [Lineus longissimus]|uniref:L-proline trans-4-hydroxylase-like isoform X2 n=1 Tax=Lineus longissimus TaxID=88925 RepID=UPI00315DE6DA
MPVPHKLQEFEAKDGDFVVTPDVQKAFDEYGYIVVRGLLEPEELSVLKTAIEKDAATQDKSYGRDDGAGRKTRVSLWNHPGDDVTGVVARAEKVAGTFEKLLGGEVYHYHSKVILKDAFTGGAHIWHQDYGYWYENGCLMPDMGTTWIALDKADESNGCLKIIPGSHKAGRVSHIRVGDQAGADPERVEYFSEKLGVLPTVLDPGDALFFHCNVLHRSDQNSSPNRRWSYLVSYNRASNDPFKEHHHPRYTPMEKVPNSKIRDCSTDLKSEGKGFFGGPKDDISLAKMHSGH